MIERRDRRSWSSWWPTGHLAWFFNGIEQFEGRATTFLMAGAARGERLMVVADNPRKDLWPKALIDRGELIVASTSDMYGPALIVSAETQLDTFAAALADALSDGYAGIRVAADNTSLVLGSQRWASWIRWEELADQFMAENPVTGMCGFDMGKVDPATLDSLQEIHPVALTD